MYRTEFTPEQIADMVIKLVGEVEPVGDSAIDNKRLESLVKLEEVVDWLIDEVYQVCGYSDNVEYSMKRAGKNANDWFKRKKDVFSDWWGDDD